MKVNKLHLESSEIPFFNDVEDLLFILGSDETIIKANHSVISHLGYSVIELESMKFGYLQPGHPDKKDFWGNPEFRERIGLSGGLLTKGGDFVPVKMTLYEQPWNNNPAVFCHCRIVQDVCDVTDGLDAFIESFPLVMSLSTFQSGAFVSVNDAFLQLFRFSRSEVIGKTSHELHIFSDEQAREELISEMDRYGFVRHKVLRVADRHGMVYIGSFSASLIWMNGNRYMLIVMDDITPEKKQELLLKENLERYAAIVDNAPEIVVIHKQGIISFVNKSGINYSGYDEQELIGKEFLNFLTPESQKIARDSIENRLKGDSVEDYEIEFIKKSDDLLNLVVKTSSVFYNDEQAILAVLIDVTERKHADRKLMESEARFRSLFENAAVGIFISDVGEKEVKRNVVFEELTGYSSEELRSMSFVRFTHPDDLEHEQKLIEDLLSKKRDSYRLVKRFVTKQGKSIWVETSVSTAKDGHGNITYLVGIVNNITEQKKLEERLKISSQAVENSPVSVVFTNLQGEIEYVNSRFITATGYSLEEVIGKTPRILKAGVQPSEFYTDLWQAILSGKEWRGEFCNKRKNGELFWEDAVVAPVLNAANEVTHFVAVKQDITERKQTDEELFRREKLISMLALAIEELLSNRNYKEATVSCFQMIGPILNVDRIGMFQCEPQSGELLRLYQKAEWTAGDDAHFKGTTGHFSVNVKEMESLFCLLNTSSPFYGMVDEIPEVAVRSFLANRRVKSAAIIPVIVRNSFWGMISFESCTYRRIWTETDFSTLSAFVSSFQKAVERSDIEETLNESKLAADAANKAKSIFLANMSHEIRTPMNAILGFSELLDNQLTDPVQQGYIKAITASSRTLLQIINDILDLSKIEAGKMELRMDTSDIRTLFQEMNHIFGRSVQAKDLAFTIELAEDIPYAVVIDELRLRQVMINLIGNAIKFTPVGSVNIQVYAGNRKKETCDLEVRISDTGIGIPAEFQKKIFEAFQQQDDQDARKYEGTGLGLAISNRLVQMMNGEIKLESSPGKGSTFSVCLHDIMIDQVSEKNRKQIIQDFYTYRFDKATVLLVDDIQNNRELVKGYLQDFNLIILEAEDGEQGIRFAREYNPDIILMDLRMPGLTGYKATRIIKSEPELQHIPIIAVTAQVFANDEKLIKTKGFDGYLRKPFRQAEILEELARFLKHRRAKPDKSHLKLNPVDFSGIEPVNFSSFVTRWDSEVQTFLDRLQKRQSTRDVKGLIRVLDQLAREFHAVEIGNMAGQLSEDIRRFDVERMKAHLHAIELLNKYLHRKT